MMGLPSLRTLDGAQTTRIWLAVEPMDMRCGFDRLAERVKAVINQDPLSGHLFVFRSRRGERDHLRLVSISDIFTPTGRIKMGVTWDLSVKKIDDQSCEFTNTVHTSATAELLDFLAKQGIPLEVFKSVRKPISEAHNKQETPFFAKSIERYALSDSIPIRLTDAAKVA